MLTMRALLSHINMSRCQQVLGSMLLNMLHQHVLCVWGMCLEGVKAGSTRLCITDK